jgi:uncharacterized membrane protein YjfL (UPF0719 family)
MDEAGREVQSLPTRSRWFAAIAGVAFSVFLSATIIVGSSPDIHSSTAETLDHFSKDSNKAVALVAWGLAAIAVLMLVWFVVEVVAHLRRTDGRDRTPQSVVIAGSILATTLTAAFAVRAAPVGDLVMDSEERASGSKLNPVFADFARTSSSLFDWALFFGAGLGAAALVICVSLASRSARALPRWLEWAGYVIAPVLAFIAFFNLIVLVAWVITVGVVVARAQRPVPDHAAGTA